MEGDGGGWLEPWEGRGQSAPGQCPALAFLGPILNVSETNVNEGSKVNVSCTAGARVQVMLDGHLAQAPGEPAQLQVTATEGDDGRYFFCNATLEVDGQVLHRDVTIQLRVLCELSLRPFNFSPLSWEDLKFPCPIVPLGNFGSDHMVVSQMVPRLTRPNVLSDWRGKIGLLMFCSARPEATRPPNYSVCMKVPEVRCPLGPHSLSSYTTMALITVRQSARGARTPCLW